MLTKAIILARGLGTRLQREADGVTLDAEAQRLAQAGLKALIPIGGRPFLDYSLDRLAQAGYTDIGLVVAPDNQAIRDYYAGKADALAGLGLRLTFIVQPEPRGTADSTLAAAEFAGPDSFTLLNGDQLYPLGDLERLRETEDGTCYLIGYDREAMLAHSNLPAERVSSCGIMSFNAAGEFLGVVEKPTQPEQYAHQGHLLLSMNCCRFTPAIFQACRSIAPNPIRHEYELPTAVQFLLDNKLAPLQVLVSTGAVLDLTGRSDIAGLREKLSSEKLEW